MTDQNPTYPAAFSPPERSTTSPPAHSEGLWLVTPAWAGRAVVVLAIVAAAVLVGPRLGLGVALVLLALGAIAARVPRPVAIPTVDLRVAEPREPDRWMRAWWVLAAALALVPVLRDATWVVVPALVTAAALASLATTGGHRWGQLVAGLGVAWARLPIGPVLASRVAARGVSVRRAGPAARGAALAAILLSVFVPLLMSADAAFAQVIEDIVPSGIGLDHPGGRIAVLAFVIAGGGALLHARLRPPDPSPRPRGFSVGAVETQIALGALVAVMAAFVALQFATLFGGTRHVLDTAGLTYAEYARSGFWQLLAVAALTFAVIAAARRWAQGGGFLLTALCLLTLVVLASALKRLGLLEETYGFTRLRFAAHAALFYLAALFCLVLVARSAAWLPRAIVAVTAGSVLLFALADPERRIAERNVDRYERTGKLDVAYLAALGADAAPELARVAKVPLPCVEADGVAGFNLARAAARRTRTDHRTAASTRCDPPRPSR
jgi:Domain of unknown function (DUF4173)